MANSAKAAKFEDLVSTKLEAPFIEINKSKAVGKLLDCVDDLTEYIKAFVKAKD
eukprot:CAMPEP_0168342336 /NCGR_PEP_ID=MMETSP0213-20121227/15313_1 /TAXON_ID=151035 /ORGANISM="Euplotes harpa, Strain FSP1.4" /LENGTH=53 /DNA_ID=CAMNT_0008349173 /DNA_START=259 /DNA_END=420 /DNA_ORIENTATION=-